jgi:hypothetical protein
MCGVRCINAKSKLNCTVEFSDSMSIEATDALYEAATVCCCLPRSAPFCIAPGKNNSDLQTTAQKSTIQ